MAVKSSERSQTNSTDLSSRVGLIHTEAQKIFIVSSQYDPPLNTELHSVTDESSLGAWTLLMGSLMDPTDDKSQMEWWGLDLEGEGLFEECEKHGHSSWLSFSQDVCSMWNLGLMSVSPYKADKWRKAFLSFDAGTSRAISVQLVKLDAATTPRLAMDLCFRMAAKLHHSDSSAHTSPISLSQDSSARRLPASFDEGPTKAELVAKIAKLQEELSKVRKLSRLTGAGAGQSSSITSPSKAQRHVDRIGPKKDAVSAREFTEDDYDDD